MAQSPFAAGGNASVIGVVAGIILVVLYFFARKPNPYPLPPGPKGEPIIGHIRIVPSQNPHLYYMSEAKKYGTDILYFKQFLTPVVVLNTVKAADELLSKRGAKYCDRPRFVLFEVLGWGITLTFLPWGAQWRAHRALLQRGFTKSNVIQYQKLQEQEARQAVATLLKPGLWETPLRRFASAIVLRVGFGISIRADDDPYIQIAIDANTATAKGGSPGTTVVDYFPFLRFLPNWLVRSPNLKHAREWGWAIQRLHDVPFAEFQKNFKNGTAQNSFALPLMEQYTENDKQGAPNDFTLKDINGAAAAIFIAGSNTTYTTTVVCILNMLLNPAVLKKARQELDRVVGTDRLPTLSDRESLRYIDYIVEETSRWRPLSPIGIPHKSIEDDIYDRFYIPKGTCVYFNVWAMSRDENIYKEPDRFYPERYTPESEGGNGEPFLQGPFGFGRRLCVGRHLAQASVFILMATLISTMDISNPIGPDGKEIEPKVTFSTGLSAHPSSFGVVFTPRSKKAEMLLRDFKYGSTAE